jgi:hypothetical protein
MAAQQGRSFQLGEFRLSFTQSQQKMINDILALSDPAL